VFLNSPRYNPETYRDRISFVDRTGNTVRSFHQVYGVGFQSHEQAVGEIIKGLKPKNYSRRVIDAEWRFDCHLVREQMARPHAVVVEFNDVNRIGIKERSLRVVTVRTLVLRIGYVRLPSGSKHSPTGRNVAL